MNSLLPQLFSDQPVSSRAYRFADLRFLFKRLETYSWGGKFRGDSGLVGENDSVEDEDLRLGLGDLENSGPGKDDLPRLVFDDLEDIELKPGEIGLGGQLNSVVANSVNALLSWREFSSESAASSFYSSEDISTSPLQTYRIYQSDIDSGTLIIDKPGRYVVMEDLVFNPNSVGTQVFGLDAKRLGLVDGDVLDAYNAGRPLASQFTIAGGDYDAKAYGIGFFAMLSFTGGASGSVLDLNGFRLEQSDEHALHQRFFSIVETAGAPFISGQGPHDFGPEGNDAVTNLVIKNGTIGQSSHHGVHGNGNKNIVIKNVEFEDYEVAAVALNGVDGLKVKNVTAASRTDVPVVGAWSNARFISAYVDFLKSLESRGSTVERLIVNGESLSAQDIQSALQESINAVFADIITEGDGRIDTVDENYYLFNNESGLVDGNSYGFLTGPVGVQVNGFPDPGPDGFETPSRNVVFKDVELLRQGANVTEVPTLSNNPNGGSQPVTDPVGAAFMLRNKQNGIYNTLETFDQSVLVGTASNNDILGANYKGNPLANAQLLVAKNRDLFEGSFLDVSRLSIGDDIINWAESDAPLSELRASLDLEDGWIYNVDNMVHVNKGVIGYKMDGVIGLRLDDVSAENILNMGQPGFDGNYDKGFVKDTLTGYGGANTYAFTFSGSSDVVVKDAEVDGVISSYGEAFGFASPLNNTSNIYFKDADVEGLVASGLPGDNVNPPGQTFDFYNV